ncbi:hypothetical protein NZL82_05890 [Sphingomonas sanguinis]|uniref:hypothetical protein n=1 Tax=Sphingomonas sp. LC-1 TaxID=3110957 RepID=UPI0021BA71C6|nr:hypothetical protein [Sphingomonas sp. LC-1]MCT8001408.1 hypothetical protein [Sphingomonas sp. LC-1]
MTSSGPRRIARLLALTLAPVLAPMLAAPALAQTAPQDGDAAARPSTNGLDGFSLSPRTTTPSGTQTPVPTPPTPRLVLPSQATPEPTPTPRATPTPRPTPRATPAPAPSPTPVEAPTPAPSPEPPATRLPDPETPIGVQPDPGAEGMTITNGQTANPAIVAPGTAAPEAGEPERDLPFWPLLIGTGLAALAIGLWLGRRSRRPQALPAPTIAPAAPPADRPAESAAPRAPQPAAQPVPAQPAAPPLPPEPSFLSVEARPLRVGLNMLTATIEAEVTVRNTGATPIGRVAVDLRLLSAHAGLDAQLIELARQPQGRPIVPPFVLAAGESRTVRGVTALPREAIHVIDAAGRPMFVPILAAAAHTDWGVSRCAYAVGLERTDSSKLSPIWLDQPGRMYDQVAARPHVMKG